MCLGVNGKPDSLNQWDATLDIVDQQTIKKDCQNYAGKFY